MGRIRTIKPEFFQHEGLYQLEKDTGLPIRLAFAGLWTCCDREGRFKWRPRQLGIQILPYDGVGFERVLDALATRDFIVKYTVALEVYGYIPTWKRHQVVNNREQGSQIPEPPTNQKFDACGTRKPRLEDPCKEEGKGKEGKELTPTSKPENGFDGSCESSDEHTPSQPEGTFQLHPPEKQSSALENALEEVFAYYIEKLHRSPTQYELTPERRKKGLKRLKECISHSKDQSLESGVRLMRLATDRLAGSPHHNGANEAGTRYVEWENHLLRRDWHGFYSFWLDAGKWTRGGAA